MNDYHSRRESCPSPGRAGPRRAPGLIKAPRIYWGDTGVALHLAAQEEPGGAHPRLADAAHVRTVRAEYGRKAPAGLPLHTGSSLEWLAPDVLAAPWWRVL